MDPTITALFPQQTFSQDHGALLPLTLAERSALQLS